MRTLTVPTSSTSFEKLAPDSYACRLVSFIDLGTQNITIKEGGKDEVKKLHKVRFGFEFPTELREDGKPFLLTREFTLSLHKKSALLPVVESMLGAKIENPSEFDIMSLMEQPYFATCIASGDGDKYTNIQTIVKLPKSMTCPDQITPTEIVFIEDWETAYDKLPVFIQDKIRASDEYNKIGEAEEILG